MAIMQTFEVRGTLILLRESFELYASLKVYLSKFGNYMTITQSVNFMTIRSGPLQLCVFTLACSQIIKSEVFLFTYVLELLSSLPYYFLFAFFLSFPLLSRMRGFSVCLCFSFVKFTVLAFVWFSIKSVKRNSTCVCNNFLYSNTVYLF
jgi:hypothetical protein